MNQIDNIMKLADEYADAGIYEPAARLRQELRAAIEQALTPGEPVAWAQNTEMETLPSDGLSWVQTQLHIVPLYTAAPQPQPVQEPLALGYWNAVEGWVELPEEAHKPTAWVYPEALEAFRKGKPWTAYGADCSGPHSDGVKRIPLYTEPQPQPNDTALLRQALEALEFAWRAMPGKWEIGNAAITALRERLK
jgi:hypothetical protein